MPARHMSPGLGGYRISLYPGQWETTISYRFLHSENIYIGSNANPAIKAAGNEPRIDVHSLDLALRYGITGRLSATLAVPVVHSVASLIHPDGVRRSDGPGVELGDLRLLGHFWVLDPLIHSDGNIVLSLGVKIPTASDGAMGTFFTPTGSVTRPMDIALQPGDGGWAMILEAQGFHRVFKNVTAFAGGFYMFSPRNTNGVEPPQSSPTNQFFMSVPDQFHARAGVSVPVRGGLSLNLAGRFDGMPVKDVFGGSDGFRRPGSSLFFDPGVTWSLGANTLSPTQNTLFLSTPIAVRRNIGTSVLDASRGVQTGGGLADFLILAGYRRRF